MEVFDCDIYSIDELLEYIVFSTGKSATINSDGKIVIDANSNSNANANAKKSGWDLRYTDIIYIMLLAIMAYFVFKKQQTEKRRSLYRPVNTDNDEM
eukprot:UN10838